MGVLDSIPYGVHGVSLYNQLVFYLKADTLLLYVYINIDNYCVSIERNGNECFERENNSCWRISFIDFSPNNDNR